MPSNDYAERLAELTSQNPQLLERIGYLAKRYIQLQAEIKKIQMDLEAKSSELNSIAGGPNGEGLLPLAFDEAGIDLLGVDGLQIQIARELATPSMAKASKYREPVLEWVEKIGQGGVIKDEVKLPFDKGDERVAQVVAFIEKMQLLYERYRTIHPGTLKALLKEILEKGEVDVPMEMLGIYEYRQAKIS